MSITRRRVVAVWLAILLAASCTSCKRSRLNNRLDEFVTAQEKQSGKQIVVIEYPGNLVSRGTNSASTIYVLLRPHASDSEIANATMFGVLNTRGFATARSVNRDQTERNFAFNLVGFVRSPKVDTELNRMGFKSDYHQLFQSYLRAMESSPPVPQQEQSKQFVASNAVGIAAALRDAPELKADIEKVASERVPNVLALAQQIGISFPANADLTSGDSYRSLSQLILFLDQQTGPYSGIRPSDSVEVVNPAKEPIESTQEQAILKDVQEHRATQLR
jgi:hypothetical protein